MKKQMIVLALASMPLLTPSILLAASSGLAVTAPSASSVGMTGGGLQGSTQSSTLTAPQTQTGTSSTSSSAAHRTGSLNPEVAEPKSPTGTLNPEVASPNAASSANGSASGTVNAGNPALAAGANATNYNGVRTGAIASPSVNDPSLVANNPNAQNQVSAPTGTATPGQVPPLPNAGGQPPANTQSGMHTPALGPKTGGAAQATAK